MSARIFISYRRDDAAGHAGRLYDRLASRFGNDQIFMDVEGIEPGVDFTKAIDKAVASCDVLLAIVGSRWLTATNRSGRRRLDDPGDFVGLEIAAALSHSVRVIPVLVHGATMPEAGDLPDALAPLAKRHAVDLSDHRWRYDVDRLMEVIETVLAEQGRSPERAIERPAESGALQRRSVDARTRDRRRERRLARVATAITLTAVCGYATALALPYLRHKLSLSWKPYHLIELEVVATAVALLVALIGTRRKAAPPTRAFAWIAGAAAASFITRLFVVARLGEESGRRGRLSLAIGVALVAAATAVAGGIVGMRLARHGSRTASRPGPSGLAAPLGRAAVWLFIGAVALRCAAALPLDAPISLEFIVGVMLSLAVVFGSYLLVWTASADDSTKLVAAVAAGFATVTSFRLLAITSRNLVTDGFDSPLFVGLLLAACAVAVAARVAGRDGDRARGERGRAATSLTG